MRKGRIMNAMDVRPGDPLADSSLINPEFIRRLQDQRTLHRQEVAFHLAEIDKHGAAEQALESMIDAAERIVAIMSPALNDAADANVPAEIVSNIPSGPEAPLPAAEAFAPDVQPAIYGHESLTSDARTESSGNLWRAKLLRSHG